MVQAKSLSPGPRRLGAGDRPISTPPAPLRHAHVPSSPSSADGRGLVYVYADESCLGNQDEEGASPGGAGGLIELRRDDGTWPHRDFAHHDPDTTNNRMGITDWVHGWARRRWKRRGGPIENLELWQELAAAAQPHGIDWRWVRGHDGHVKNE